MTFPVFFGYSCENRHRSAIGLRRRSAVGVSLATIGNSHCHMGRVVGDSSNGVMTEESSPCHGRVRAQPPLSFGEALYRLRQRQGMQQIAVARAARVSKGYYSSVENSKRSPPSLRTIQRIAQVLDLTTCEQADLEALAEHERSGAREDIPLPLLRLVARLRAGCYQLPACVLKQLNAELDRA